MMKSKITIEVDFNNQNKPCIVVKHVTPSDDVRDKLIQNFFKALDVDSQWCKIVPDYVGGSPGENYSVWNITPLSPADLLEESESMRAAYIAYNHLYPKTKTGGPEGE